MFCTYVIILPSSLKMAFLCMCCPVYVVYVHLSGPISNVLVEADIIADEVSLPDVWMAMLEFVAPPCRTVEFFIVPIIYDDE